MIPHKKCNYVPKRICHTRKTSSLSKDEITSSIIPLGLPKQKEIIKKRNTLSTSKARTNRKQEKDSNLPEHLRNFKEFHSLHPPISSHLRVLNRRIKRSTR